MPKAKSSHITTDAELIARCLSATEHRLEDRYRGAIDGDYEESDEDFERFRLDCAFILTTRATTLEGFKAKALFTAAYNCYAYECEDSDTWSMEKAVSSLLHDMVAPLHGGMIAKLALKYGPLPPLYDQATMKWFGWKATGRGLEAA